MTQSHFLGKKGIARKTAFGNGIYLPKGSPIKYRLPLFAVPVSAGFPSPADDYLEDNLNLHTFLVKRPAATFFVTARGDSMIDAGIHDGDLLVVDRSLESEHSRIIIVLLDGEFIVRRLQIFRGVTHLVAANEAYEPIEIFEGMELEIWGVVIAAVHFL